MPTHIIENLYFLWSINYVHTSFIVYLSCYFSRLTIILQYSISFLATRGYWVKELLYSSGLLYTPVCNYIRLWISYLYMPRGWFLERGHTNGHHKTHNGWYLGLVAPISSIVGLLILLCIVRMCRVLDD